MFLDFIVLDIFQDYYHNVVKITLKPKILFHCEVFPLNS